MTTLVNTRLLSHPLNWLTVWSMALLAFYIAHLLTSYWQDRHPGVPVNDSPTRDAAGPGTDVPEQAFA